MGLYDYIDGDQVKCFYNCYFWLEFDKPVVHVTNGRLSSYGIGDSVPYKTTYYDHTPNFIIFDYRTLDPVHIIRDGKVEKTLHIAELKEDDLKGIQRVIDYYGKPLPLKKPSDFNAIYYDYQKYWELSEPLVKQNFKAIDAMREDFKVMTTAEAEAKYELATQANNNEITALRNKYCAKWYYTADKIERKLGELFVCYEDLMDTDKTEKIRQAEGQFKQMVLDYMEENPEAYRDYLLWLGYPEMVEWAKGVYKLIMD